MEEKTMNIHFILHETFEVPGAYLKWAQDRGHNITSTKVYEEEVLPETVEGIDFLIVMGGPQSPDEDRQAFPYYDPEAEIAFMQKAIAADIYIVGVCLGAQLLSVAYGGKYEHSPEREIGVFPVTLTEAGLADEHIKGFGKTLNTGHWHGDMPGLTDNAVVLATSQGCPRQIVRFSPKHYAFQAHLEFDPEASDLLIAADTRIAQVSRHGHTRTDVHVQQHDARPRPCDMAWPLLVLRTDDAALYSLPSAALAQGRRLRPAAHCGVLGDAGVLRPRGRTAQPRTLQLHGRRAAVLRRTALCSPRQKTDTRRAHDAHGDIRRSSVLLQLQLPNMAVGAALRVHRLNRHRKAAAEDRERVDSVGRHHLCRTFRAASAHKKNIHTNLSPRRCVHGSAAVHRGVDSIGMVLP